MRLVCPNCDAEYEVDATLIPDAGRDVQCSNCGHAWFQGSPAIEAETVSEAALFAPAVGGAADQDDEPDLPPPPPPAPPAPAAAARSIDASVLSVLREEAERESMARASESSSLEMQGEMGLGGRAPGSGDAATDRIARMKDDAEVHSAPGQSALRGAAAKSDMLPEIDTINSTLRAKSERRGGEQAAIAETMAGERGAGGFRRGFLISMTVIILALALYLFAPLLIAKVPAAASPLRAYVGYIDGLRMLVDLTLQGIIAKIMGLIGTAQ
jgi:predicted Zn finger-like uncharacterized protein